jgi:hypothetical protein
MTIWKQNLSIGSSINPLLQRLTSLLFTLHALVQFLHHSPLLLDSPYQQVPSGGLGATHRVNPLT